VDPIFLGLDEVIEIHRDQIERYGGTLGIRDLGLLKSALAQPSASFGDQYLHRDLSEMATAYLFHIVQNHPFIDGNKRVGAAVATVFLLLNDVEFNAPENEFEKLVLKAANGRAKKDEIAEFFRKHSG